MTRKHGLILAGLFVLFLILTLAKSALYEDYKAKHNVGAQYFAYGKLLEEHEPIYQSNIIAHQVGQKWKTAIIIYPQNASYSARGEVPDSSRPFREPTHYVIINGHEFKLTMNTVYLTNMSDVVATAPIDEVFSQPFDPKNPFEGYETELQDFVQKMQ